MDARNSSSARTSSTRSPRPRPSACSATSGLSVKFPQRTFATVDHIVPTINQDQPADPLAAEMIDAIRKNCDDFGVTYFDLASGKQGIVHVVGPEQGITQPGTTIACGDSHTATHGAFGAIAFGIGTSQVRDVLATQTIALQEMKVRRIEVNGDLAPGVYAKDVILHIIRLLGVNGGIGYAYEYAGDVFDRMSMEERMTVCNMSIEGGARCGYVNPDDKTVAYLNGRPYVDMSRLQRHRRPLAVLRLRCRRRATTTSSKSTPPTSRRPSPGASPRTKAFPFPRTSRTPPRPRLRWKRPPSRKRSPT